MTRSCPEALRAGLGAMYASESTMGYIGWRLYSRMDLQADEAPMCSHPPTDTSVEPEIYLFVCET